MCVRSYHICVRSYYTGFSGYLALSILLHQVLQVEVHVVFAQNVIAQGVFVVYSNLESALHELLVQEGERLVEDDVFPASLQSSHSSAARYSTARKAKPGLFKKASHYPCTMSFACHCPIAAIHKGLCGP